MNIEQGMLNVEGMTKKVTSIVNHSSFRIPGSIFNIPTPRVALGERNRKEPQDAS
jgi:hypothetical protein